MGNHVRKNIDLFISNCNAEHCVEQIVKKELWRSRIEKRKLSGSFEINQWKHFLENIGNSGEKAAFKLDFRSKKQITTNKFQVF